MENAHQPRVSQLLRSIAGTRDIIQDLIDLVEYLPNSEYELILCMIDQGVWIGAPPPPPSGFEPGDGTVELGLIWYWASNPSLLDLSKFSPDDQDLILVLCDLIYELTPGYTNMNSSNYDFLLDNPITYSDGSILGMGSYETYDQGWFVAFLNLVQTIRYWAYYNDGIFPLNNPPTIALSGAKKNVVNIVLVGDWGTGDATSKAVMDQIVALKPDYIVHVGDVYYSGSPLAGDPNGLIYFNAGEESDHLVGGWPDSYVGRSFTLNSNHEMYSGANGFFYDALGTSQKIPPGNFFIAQQGSTCWIMRYGEWSILGLDSAFMAKSSDAFMTGSIGSPYSPQAEWIAGLQLDPEKVIVLTHHNGFAQDCSAYSSLWTEVSGALGKDPYAWYWGHVHYGIVYDAPITIPFGGGRTTNTYARCLGHGALPYGPASCLEGKPIAYSSDSRQPPPSNLLYNGFAQLTLTLDDTGQVASITESYYDLSQKTPVYTKPIF